MHSIHMWTNCIIPLLLLLLLPFGWVHSEFSGCPQLPCENGATCVRSGGQVSCHCPVGYTGERCEQPCRTESTPSHSPLPPCATHSRVGYPYACPPGWEGVLCEKDVNECVIGQRSPCEHNGTCVNTPGGFKCQCRPGFTGVQCEDRIFECDRTPCMNHGTCIEEHGVYRCVCTRGFEGIHCEENINECADSPCANRGQCEDLIGEYRCHCLAGWAGAQCDRPVATCRDKPCLHGECEETYGPKMFHCICPNGYKGDRCEFTMDYCDRNPCENGGQCETRTDGWHCVCPPGFTGQLCTESETVTPDPHTQTQIVESTSQAIKATQCQTDSFCLNGGHCLSNECHCPTGFDGHQCEQRVDLCSSKPCLSEGTCIQNTSVPDGYICKCVPGLTGKHCEQNRFDCFQQPCGWYGTCMDRTDGFQCHCLNGHIGTNCERREMEAMGINKDSVNDMVHHTPTPSTVTDSSCSNLQCENGAQCMSSLMNRSETCNCDTAVGLFTGSQCHLDVDECVLDQDPCQNGAQCVNTYGSYFCRCPSGYGGVHCQLPLDPCSFESTPVCQNGGTCLARQPSTFECRCPIGFTGSLCEVNINDCEPNPCQNGGLCDDHIASYACQCPHGYGGPECQFALTAPEAVIADDCAPGNIECKSSQLARTCENGGTWNTSTDPYVDHHCDCPIGFTGSKCEAVIDLCRFIPSGNGLTVWRPQLTTTLDDSVQQLGSCSHLGTSQCIPLRGNFNCVCHEGFSGRLCEIRRDLCQEASDSIGGEPFCMNNGVCEIQIRRPISFSNETQQPDGLSIQAVCQCPPGYTGLRCDRFIAKCRPNPCQHGGSCQTLDKSNQMTALVPSAAPYQCLCPPAWAGIHCEVQVSSGCLESNETCHGNHTSPDSLQSGCIEDEKVVGGQGGRVCRSCAPGFCGPVCQFHGDRCNSPGQRDQSNITSIVTTNKPISSIGYSNDELPAYVDQCDRLQCRLKRQNGHCDRDCNSLNCEFDGLECLLSITQPLQPVTHWLRGTHSHKKLGTDEIPRPQPVLPWNHCQSEVPSNGVACHLKFEDGHCDMECSQENCLFDGWDCESTVSTRPTLLSNCSTSCRSLLSDGVCNPECNRTECSFDGGDCLLSGGKETKDSTTEHSQNAPLTGELVLLLNVNPHQLVGGEDSIPSGFLPQLLTGLEELLHLTVHLSSFNLGANSSRRAFPVRLRASQDGSSYAISKSPGHRNAHQVMKKRNSTRGMQRRTGHFEMQRLRLPRQADTRRIVASQVHLKLDATRCHREGGSCFKHVDKAAQFVIAAMHRGRHAFLKPVLSVQSTHKDSPGAITVEADDTLGRLVPAGESKNRSVRGSKTLWSRMLLFVVLGVLIMGLLIGVMFTIGQHLQQSSSAQSTYPAQSGGRQARRSLASHLHLIGIRRNADKIQRARVWYPKHGDFEQGGRLEKCATPGRLRRGGSTVGHMTFETMNGKSPVFVKPMDQPLASCNGFLGYLTGDLITTPGCNKATTNYSCTLNEVPQLQRPNSFSFGRETQHDKSMTHWEGSNPKMANSLHPTVSNTLDSFKTHSRHLSLAYPDTNDCRSVSTVSVRISTTGSMNCDPEDQQSTERPKSSTSSSSVPASAVSTSSSGLREANWVASSQELEAAEEENTVDLWYFQQLIDSLRSGDGLTHGSNGTSVPVEEMTVSHLLSRVAQRDRMMMMTTTMSPMIQRHSFQTHVWPVGRETRGFVDPEWTAHGMSDGRGNALDVNIRSPSRLTRLLTMRLPDTAESLLHLAARLNRPTAVLALLDAGADPTAVDKAGRTVLLTAVSAGSVDATHAILTHPAAGSNPLCFVPSLLTDCTTPLIQAVKLGDFDSFKLILHAMNLLVCSLVRSPTYTMTKTELLGGPTPQSSTVSYITNNNHCMGHGLPPPDTITSPIEDGLLKLLDLNVSDEVGRTALHWAAATNQADFIHCLLDAGASSDVQTMHEETPLALAAKEGALQACHLLLLNGANPELADYLDRSPHQLAELNGHTGVAQLLNSPSSVHLIHSSRSIKASPSIMNSFPGLAERTTVCPSSNWHDEEQLTNQKRFNSLQKHRDFKSNRAPHWLRNPMGNTNPSRMKPPNRYNPVKTEPEDTRILKPEITSPLQTTLPHSNKSSHPATVFNNLMLTTDQSRPTASSGPVDCCYRQSSGSESPNHWSSSSPSDSSPKHQGQAAGSVPNVAIQSTSVDTFDIKQTPHLIDPCHMALYGNQSDNRVICSTTDPSRALHVTY